jgi:YYY domain-containing protein
MLESLLWWLLIELIGMAVLPVAFRFLCHLPDRGYAFVKPLGLLLMAYPFWLLTTFGFMTNTRGAIALVVVGVAAASWWFFGRARSMVDRQQTNVDSEPPAIAGESGAASPTTYYDSPLEWLQDNARLVFVAELVFTTAFFAWVFVRAYMPEITATEKPMEFAFLNGVLQSDHFPPLDPWLSGYAISYYYFGYIIVGMLTLLSGVASSVAFNLAIALLFALAATGAFGLAYNLIQNSKLQDPHTAISGVQQMVFALFAPVFLLLAGNLEGFFEALHAKGVGSLGFWNWLDVKGLASAPPTNSFVPNDNWWWWRASRVVHDVVAGQTQEVIDEFPQFSFLLGDMHPHVLALPFVLLALAVALNLLKSKFELENGRLNFRACAVEWVLLPVVLGGLFFLNSWDILPYGFVLLVAFAVARYRVENRWNLQVTRDLAVFAVALGVLSVLLYLPFYIGFQSQAGGILPTLFVKTQLHQYLIMFGLFVFILGAFLARLVFEYRANRPLLGAADESIRSGLSRIATPVGAIIAFPFLVAVLALVVIAARPDLQEQARAAFPGTPDNIVANVVAAYFGPWLSDPWLFVLLTVFLASIIVLVRIRLPDDSTTFVLLLAFTGFLLTFGVEFVYLRDQFGTRMNTIFKFYFQTWTLLSIAGAYAVFYLARALNGVARGAWFAGLALLLGASLIYPALAVPNRADNFVKNPQLDGIAWIGVTNPGDYAAIQWLAANAPRGAHILEAVGDDYSYGNRISMATGLATPQGWFGHESQWRGNTRLFKDDATGIDRGADIARIYQTLDLPETLTLLGKYDISFVVVGQEERAKYGLTRSQIDKFGRMLTLVLDKDDLRIYARSN